MTKNKAEEIVKSSKNFLRKETVIDGYKIVSFDYQDGTKYSDFKEYDAFELRGLTFVEDVCFPMLHKFFNLGEKHENEIEEAKEKKIKSIQIKDDGSLIGFIVLPNGRVVAKTKMGFSNPFTTIANKWLAENNNDEKIRELFHKGIFPLFECVSNKEKIVLSYDWEGLILIQARTSDFGYLNVSQLSDIASEYNWNFKEPLSHNLDTLFELKDKESDIEGFIVRFDDDTFTKVKTAWYFDQHSSNEAVDYTNELLDNYFKGELPSDKDEKEFIMNLSEKVFKPNNISSILQLKSFIFRDGDEKSIQLYKQYYKTFLTEYKLQNNYHNENTLIKLILEDSIDDILPELNKEERKNVEVIQEKLISYIRRNVNEIIETLDKNITHKEIQEKFKGSRFMGILMKNNGKEYTVDSITQMVKDVVLKNTKKLQAAREFLNSI